MRVLWFEVTVPKAYAQHEFHGAGWQDSLESIVKSCADVELGVAFEGKNGEKTKKIDCVNYFPLVPRYSAIEKLGKKLSHEVSRNKLIPLSLKVIELFKPDVIHVFGSEWCFGQVAEYVDIPVVIHMQGSIPPYDNAFYPPGYNLWDEMIFNLANLHLMRICKLLLGLKKRKTWKIQEEHTLSVVKNYMGRTGWDKNIVNLYHPNARYYYCSEALRASFIQNARQWVPIKNEKLILTTTGCSSFWKGLDTIVRTARFLKERNVDFEWCLAGKINYKKFIEWKEKTRMEDVNIRLMGMLNADELSVLLMRTNIYVHTAYIDNSPNSICEAQYLGLPIIATYVGGIPSLIQNNFDGLLVPANDPYMLAIEVIKLAENKQRQIFYSENARKTALERHNPQKILKDLRYIYKDLIKK